MRTTQNVLTSQMCPNFSGRMHIFGPQCIGSARICTHTCTHCLSVLQCCSVPHFACDSDMTVFFCGCFRFPCSDSKEWKVLPGILEKDPIQITVYPWQPLANIGSFFTNIYRNLYFCVGCIPQQVSSALHKVVSYGANRASAVGE